MNIYSMNDCDWVAAETPEEAIAFYLETISAKNTPEDRAEYLEEPIVACSEEALKKLQIHDVEAKVVRSFSEQLALEIEQKQAFPCFFASTEY